MDDFAARHQCSGRALRQRVTYGGQYTAMMRPHQERGEEARSSVPAEAPPRRLAEVFQDYRKQHPGPIVPEKFVTFAKAEGVRTFQGLKRILAFSEVASEKPTAAAPGTTVGDNTVISERDGGASTSQCRIAAEAWHELNPAARAITNLEAFAGAFGVTRRAISYYVDFTGAYRQPMLDLLAREHRGRNTPAGMQAAPPRVADIAGRAMVRDDAGNLECNRGGEPHPNAASVRAPVNPMLPVDTRVELTTVQSDMQELSGLTDSDWATLQAVLLEAVRLTNEGP